MDYTKVQDKYSDSLSQLDLQNILNNGKHGELNFLEIQDLSDRMIRTIFELEVLDYRNIGLPQSVIREVENFRGNVMGYINLIKDFTISRSDATQVRTEWVTQMKALYDNSFYRIEEILNNIKINHLFQDKGELEKQINSLNDVESIKNQLLTIKESFETELVQLKTATKDKGNETGNLISSEYFDIQASNHSNEKGRWLNQRRYFFIALIMWSLLSIILFLILNTNGLNNISSIALGISELLGFILIYFGFSFSTNNYYIERGLEIENLHRKNIANTAPKLQLGVNQDDHRAIIIAEEVKSLFSPIGAKMESKGTEITTPFLEIIKGLIGKIQ